MWFSSKSIKSVSSDESPLPPDLPAVSIGLTVLHEDEAALVDIITIHGLSGHPQNTWTNFTTSHYWPRNSLPEDIPRSRIMAFGYNTSASPFNKSTAIISDISKQLISHLINKRKSEEQKQRLIIFVAHSLELQFLHVASNTGHENLANCVCGILFLGTPHKGSHLASFMDILSGVLKSISARPADAIIKDLSSNSRHLLELDQLLRFKLSKIDIYTFYELLPMGPLRKPVVERHSALLNLPSELEQIGLEADHRQMCKPVDRYDFIYETITQRIISIMNRQIDKARYSKALLEMANSFASRQMEHISALTKDLQKDQAGSDMASAFAFINQITTLHVTQSVDPGTPQTHGFEEVLKSLPSHKVKSVVEGIQNIIKRANSLTDLLLLTERQNERRKAEARFEAERKINEQRVQELLTENARLQETHNPKMFSHGSPEKVESARPPSPISFEPPFRVKLRCNFDDMTVHTEGPAVPMACSACHGKQLKCDGRIPCTARCMGSKSECVYENEITLEPTDFELADYEPVDYGPIDFGSLAEDVSPVPLQSLQFPDNIDLQLHCDDLPLLSPPAHEQPHANPGYDARYLARPENVLQQDPGPVFPTVASNYARTKVAESGPQVDPQPPAKRLKRDKEEPTEEVKSTDEIEGQQERSLTRKRMELQEMVMRLKECLQAGRHVMVASEVIQDV